MNLWQSLTCHTGTIHFTHNLYSYYTELIPQQEDDLFLFILGLMRHENCPIHLPIRIPNYGQFATNAMEHLALSIMKTDNYTISTPH